MMKTFAIALVCAVSAVSMAQARRRVRRRRCVCRRRHCRQRRGRVDGSLAAVGRHGPRPRPVSACRAARVVRLAAVAATIDTNQAQQPASASTAAAGNGSIKPLGR